MHGALAVPLGPVYSVCSLDKTKHCDFSGGARVFAARGKRLSCIRPRQTDKFYSQGIFQDFGRGVLTNPWARWMSPSSFVPSHFLASSPLSPSTLPYLTSSLPLEVGPYIQLGGLRSAVSFPSGV